MKLKEGSHAQDPDLSKLFLVINPRYIIAIYFRDYRILVDASQQNCNDSRSFISKYIFRRVCQMLFFSLGVVVSVELSVACNMHIGENEMRGRCVSDVSSVHPNFFSIFSANG